MTEQQSAADLDSTQCAEKTIENIVPLVAPEHDTKQMAGSATEDTMEQVDVSPSSPSPSLEQWNHPRPNMYRYFAALYSFIIMGMNDAASGVSIPRLIWLSILLTSFTGINSICRSPQVNGDFY